MQRAIHCSNCGHLIGRELSSEDMARNFVIRFVRLIVKCPESHGIEVNGVFEPMDSIHCDLCNTEILDGEIAWARTIWNSNREGTPGPWENDFGKVIAEDVAKLAELLSKPLQFKTL